MRYFILYKFMNVLIFIFKQAYMLSQSENIAYIIFELNINRFVLLKTETCQQNFVIKEKGQYCIDYFFSGLMCKASPGRF